MTAKELIEKLNALGYDGNTAVLFQDDNGTPYSAEVSKSDGAIKITLSRALQMPDIEELRKSTWNAVHEVFNNFYNRENEQ